MAHKQTMAFDSLCPTHLLLASGRKLEGPKSEETYKLIIEPLQKSVTIWK